MAGKRYAWPKSVCPISENVEDFAPRRVIAHISANLSFYVVRSTCRRTGSIDRDAFPPGRETIHMAGAFPDFGERFPIWETRRILRREWLFPTSPQI